MPIANEKNYKLGLRAMPSTFFARKPPRRANKAIKSPLKYGFKVKDRKYRGRYMPIATGIGYVIAKQKGLKDKEAKSIGYAFALMPNILRNGSMSGLRRDNGVWVSKPKLTANNDDKMIELGLTDKVRYVEMGSFSIGLIENKAFAPRMRELKYWTENDFESQMAKLSQNQQNKMFDFIEKELKELKLSAKMLDYKIAKHWDTFFQVLMEKVGDYIY